MSFKLPKEAREYFKLIEDADSQSLKFAVKFDMYYLCLMVGLNNRKLATEDKVETEAFITYYPEGFYGDKSLPIAGLLIDAEMERKAIEPSDRTSIEALILELIDHQKTTKLSDKGIERLNQYAARGMEIIRDNIPKTRELETFLVHYYKLLNQG